MILKTRFWKNFQNEYLFLIGVCTYPNATLGQWSHLNCVKQLDIENFSLNCSLAGKQL